MAARGTRFIINFEKDGFTFRIDYFVKISNCKIFPKKNCDFGRIKVFEVITVINVNKHF